MTGPSACHPIVRRATKVEKSFRLKDGVYLLGTFERGVTVYKQQVRAHNLVWAIWELHNAGKLDSVNRIAVVGGGIAGLTAAACFLSLFGEASVTVFERLWDLCPLQQGSDNRWLHPRILRLACSGKSGARRIFASLGLVGGKGVRCCPNGRL